MIGCDGSGEVSTNRRWLHHYLFHKILPQICDRLAAWREAGHDLPVSWFVIRRKDETRARECGIPVRDLGAFSL